jgi:hypothetical protein
LSKKVKNCGGIMGFLKNAAIKSTTKKRFTELIAMILKAPETSPLDTLNNFVFALKMQGMNIEIPNDITSWDQLHRYLVYLMVFNELNYDPNVGSKEDFNLITETINEETIKLKQQFKGA